MLRWGPGARQETLGNQVVKLLEIKEVLQVPILFPIRISGFGNTNLQLHHIMVVHKSVVADKPPL